MASVASRPPGAVLAIDLPMILLTAALLAIGFIAISSASVGYAEATYGDMWHLSQRHFVYLALATTAALLCYQLPVHFWYRTGWLWLMLASLLLILVLVPGVGRNVNGSQRWLVLGPLTLQPSELAKGAMLVYLAGYLVRHEDAVREGWKGFLRPLLVLGIIAVLLLAEPDFGAAMILICTAGGLLFLAGMRMVHLGVVVASGVAMVVGLILMAPYRMQRIIAYTDPWDDPFGKGFQLVQSLIAFGRGEWLGVGLGNSVQKLFYLPEAHTDFVFSIWAEETGFVGAVLLITLFLALVLRIFLLGQKAQAARQGYAAYFCYGVALMFSGQAFINMGVSAGLLPTKGLTLPLVSYGGTSLICSCALLGMVMRVHSELENGRKGRKR